MKRSNDTILPVNKTVVYYSPCEDTDILVRTGTIADNSCFFHSLLHAYSKDYVSMDKKGREGLVKRLRQTLDTTINTKQWEKVSSNTVVKIPFQERVNRLLSDLYRYVLQNKKGKTKNGRQVIRQVVKSEHDSETYSIIFEMLGQKELQQNISTIYNNTGDLPLSSVKEKILQSTKKYYENIVHSMGKKYKNSKQVKYCLEKLLTMMIIVLDEAEDHARIEYILSIKDTTNAVDKQTLQLIAKQLNRDIYVIDSKTGLPIDEYGSSHIVGRKSIILLCIDNIHYEVIGRLVTEHKVQREFPSNDPLILKLKTFICEPKIALKKYPELFPHLTKERRSKYKSSSEKESSHKKSDRESIHKSSQENEYESEEYYEASSSIEKSESESSAESDKESNHKRKKYRKSRRKRRVK